MREMCKERPHGTGTQRNNMRRSLRKTHQCQGSDGDVPSAVGHASISTVSQVNSFLLLSFEANSTPNVRIDVDGPMSL